MRRPLARFLILGVSLFLVARALQEAPVTPEAVIPASEVEALRHRFVTEQAREPVPAELAALVEERIDEEVLLQEALALGLDEGDPVVERRLLENVRFLDARDSRAAGGGQADAARLREAAALGMAPRDPVVRRRLVNRMWLRLASDAHGEAPSDAELAAERLHRANALRTPPRVKLTQIYLGPSDASAQRRADSLLRAVAAGAALDPAREAAPLALPVEIPSRTEDLLARGFGPAFARDAFALPQGIWSAVSSQHGLHLVRVDGREAGKLPELPAVSERLRDAILGERDERNVRAALMELRRRHPVVVESAEPKRGDAS
jgi:hypothetical protein